MVVTSIATLIGLFIGLVSDQPFIWTLLGLLTGRLLVLEWRVSRLRGASARPSPLPGWALTTERPVSAASAEPRAEAGISAKGQVRSADAAAAAHPKPAIQQPKSGRIPAANQQPAAAAADWGDLGSIGKWTDQLVGALTGGNLFLRVGILILFFGVGFLIKYAVDQQLLVFTPLVRLLAVAVAGLGLLGLGAYLARRRREYGLALQGAAIGILYLDVYGAYQLYQLLPVAPAFALMLVIGLGTAGLAVRQDAPALAWFGFAGGFLAPLLASSGARSPTALFGLYALLDAAILAVAWYKRWRALNLLGFGFSFGIGGLWIAFEYSPALFWTIQPFLVLFFLFFVAITVLYAMRQPPQLRGWIDATLLFGTPALGFSGQVTLIRHLDNGIAWSAAALGLFYLSSALLLRRGSAGLSLLARAFAVLGVIFLSVAVPYALSAGQTAGVWALQGAGMIWIGVRQRRAATRLLGLVLQAGAALALAAGHPYPSPEAFLNPFFWPAAMLAVAGAVSAYWMDRLEPSRLPWDQGAAPMLLTWGLAWWLGAGLHELLLHYPSTSLPAGLLFYGTLTALLAEVAGRLRPWPRLDRVETLLPGIGIAALAASLAHVAHPTEAGGAIAWPLLLGVCWLLLAAVEHRGRHGLLPFGHVATGLLLIAVVQWEIGWRVLDQLQLSSGWRVAALALAPTLLLQLLIHGRGWPIGRWPDAYRLVLGGTLAALLVVWGLWSAADPGDADPLTWLPVLNPADLMLAAALITLYQWARVLHRRVAATGTPIDEPLIRIILGTLGLLWVNLVVLRSMHQLWGVPYEPEALLQSVPTQMAISVVWGITGVGLLLAAGRLRSRPIWFTGAGVLAAVVAKLFVVDLAATGSLERIISFLAVGALLMGVGWFAQLPPPISTEAGRDSAPAPNPDDTDIHAA
jgi:uncharacterized membrane protein